VESEGSHGAKTGVDEQKPDMRPEPGESSNGWRTRKLPVVGTVHLATTSGRIMNLPGETSTEEIMGLYLNGNAEGNLLRSQQRS
jgi:hypothetical protein